MTEEGQEQEQEKTGTVVAEEPHGDDKEAPATIETAPVSELQSVEEPASEPVEIQDRIDAVDPTSDVAFEMDREGKVSLPKVLQVEGEAIETALASDGNLEAAYRQFIAAALRKPKVIGDACRWLVRLFSGSMSVLAKLAQAGDLVTELGLGSHALTNAVSVHWDATGQMHRLVRLAEAALTAQHKLGNRVAAEFEAALAASMAFGRPKLAKQLIDVAAQHLPSEGEPGLTVARRNLSVGLLLQLLPTEARIFWTNQLRNPHRECDWSDVEARSAVQALARQLELDSAEALQFKEAMPPDVWRQIQTPAVSAETKTVDARIEPTKADKPASEEANEEAAPLAEKAESSAPANEPASGEKAAEPEKEGEAVVVVSDSLSSATTSTEAAEKKPLTIAPVEPRRSSLPSLVVGILLGACLMVAVAYRWVQEHGLTDTIRSTLLASSNTASVKSEPKPVKPEPVALPASPPAVPATAASKARSGPVPAAPPPAASEPAPVTVSIAKAVIPEPATAPVVPAAVPVRAELPSPAASAFETWQKTKIDDLEKTFPSLRRWHVAAKSGTIMDAAPLLAGAHPTAFSTPMEHRALLKWLVIDPPRDAEVCRSVFNTLIRLCPPGECLELFEPVCQFKAQDADEARRAAGVMLDLFADRLSVEASRRLRILADGK